MVLLNPLQQATKLFETVKQKTAELELLQEAYNRSESSQTSLKQQFNTDIKKVQAEHQLQISALESKYEEQTKSQQINFESQLANSKEVYEQMQELQISNKVCCF